WRPMTIASIRDIMQEGRADKRVAESVRAVREWFDLVLVHGDPGFIRIEETLQGVAAFPDKIRYGGFVTPPPPDLSRPATIRADVVVSAGGGAFGHALTSAALGAMRHSRMFPGDWLVIAGSERSEAEFLELKAAAPEGIRVERFVPDLTRVLAAARVSVSRAGYNTMGDLLRAGCRSVLVPYEGGRETEQLRRARRLVDKGMAVMLTDDQLSPENLAEAVDRAKARPPFTADWDLEGAAHAADIILEEHARLPSAVAPD
ncbi:MAG: glycosyltransferase, partial [Pseudomonadota bacterium]|nr:glycosyltransferase [Pseudomonadota bacterium]